MWKLPFNTSIRHTQFLYSKCKELIQRSNCTVSIINSQIYISHWYTISSDRGIKAWNNIIIIMMMYLDFQKMCAMREIYGPSVYDFFTCKKYVNHFLYVKRTRFVNKAVSFCASRLTPTFLFPVRPKTNNVL